MYGSASTCILRQAQHTTRVTRVVRALLQWPERPQQRGPDLSRSGLRPFCFRSCLPSLVSTPLTRRRWDLARVRIGQAMSRCGSYRWSRGCPRSSPRQSRQPARRCRRQPLGSSRDFGGCFGYQALNLRVANLPSYPNDRKFASGDLGRWYPFTNRGGHT